MQFYTSLLRGELPLDRSAPVVAIAFPGGHFGSEFFLAFDATIGALHRKGGKIDLRNVQPGAMLGRVHKFDFTGQLASGLRIEALVEGRGVVRKRDCRRPAGCARLPDRCPRPAL